MEVSKETLRAMLSELGGLEMTDEELAKAVPLVQAYVDRMAKLKELDLSTVMSARLLRAKEGA